MLKSISQFIVASTLLSLAPSNAFATPPQRRFSGRSSSKPPAAALTRDGDGASGTQLQQKEVDLYDENGEEIANVEDINSLELERDDISGEDICSTREQQPNSKKLIECSAHEGLANDASKSSTPLRQSKWTVGVKGMRFSWTARDKRIIRPNWIEWESTSGMKNSGSVEFIQLQSLENDGSTETEMKLCFTFVTPRIVSSLFRRSGRIRTYTEDVLLMSMLTDFRDAVVVEDLKE
eukprot:scaffold436_cov188-Alexandrium_tamarense.AAC.23